MTTRDIQIMEIFVKHFIDHPRGAILFGDILSLGRKLQEERNLFFKLYLGFTGIILTMTTLIAALSQIDSDNIRLTMLLLGVFVTLLKGIMETFSVNANYENR